MQELLVPHTSPTPGDPAAADKPGGLVEPLAKHSLINASRRFPKPSSTWQINLNYLCNLNSVYFKKGSETEVYTTRFPGN